MAEHNELGRTGEEEACRFLMHQGYTLLDRNWRTEHLEIDIVAEWYGEIVFVEVKTRRDEHFAQAVEAVTLQKKRHLVAAARAYLLRHSIDRPFRFDIITVVGTQRPFQIKHYRFAYNMTEVREQSRRSRSPFEA